MKCKTNDMNTLRDDLKVPLDKVQRWWIRRPNMLILLVVVIPLGALYGICKLTKQWFEDCW